jgi:hypothetical protein
MADMAEDPVKHLQLSIAGDAGGYLRRQCPRCGQDFKQKGPDNAQQDALAWWLLQTLRDAQLTSPEDGGLPTEDIMTCCPYCAKLAPPQDFVHPELVSYIRRVAQREIIEPMFFRMFGNIDSGLRSSVRVRLSASGPSVRSPRPISGPEPDDLIPVHCLECNCAFKVDGGWRGTVHCPECHTELLPL